jgi:hypothetical protein
VGPGGAGWVDLGGGGRAVVNGCGICAERLVWHQSKERALVII